MPAPVPLSGLDHDAGQVANKHKIAPRLGDEAALARRQALEKDRQRPADIARADDIGEAKSYPIDAAQLDVVLARGFRDGIAAVHWIERMVRA